MTAADLFAGIGGFRLGLETAGFEFKWACEIDPYCRKVYLKHWPGTDPFYEDIREVHDAPEVDLLCGGFPCQDVSLAGKRAGITGERSGLWSEFARLIGEVRPRYALIENVPGLLVRGLERVLFDLSEIGYDAEWHSIPAAAFGAPHIRDRVWIIAYATGDEDRKDRSSNGSDDVADASSIRRKERRGLFSRLHQQTPENGSVESVRDRNRWASGQWAVEPRLGELVDGLSPELAGRFIRVAKGCPDRSSKLRALGNAVVPQVVEWIGRRIMEAEAGA